MRGEVDWYDRDAWYAGISAGLFFGGDPVERPRVAPPVISDGDGDGVTDNIDQCPNTAAGAIVDDSGCLVAVIIDTDSDDDGVTNSDDQCPDTRPGISVDNRGCKIPDEIHLPDVKFESDSDVLRPGGNSVMNEAAETLMRNTKLVVEVAGYTDSQGNADYNVGLSERRAKTVRDYLIYRGVDEGQLSWHGYGEDKPVADNSTAQGREENRRVVLRILKR